MPTKCMAQMPVPMANAPPAIHQRAAWRGALDTRSARLSAVYEARMATRTDSRTNGDS